MNMTPPKFFLCILAGIWVLGIACCHDYDTVSRHYSTLAEAREAIQKGWIPACLPHSAHNIRDTHSLDTNDGYGKFEFAPADFPKLQLEKLAQKADFDARKLTFDKWKPLADAGYLFVAIPEFIIAVHPSGKGQYWLSPDSQ